jgi:hypothetical protein
LKRHDSMTTSTLQGISLSLGNGWPVQFGYFDLKTLASYSSCSVRWLRDRLIDRNYPLPHYRVGGKLLVKREEFDTWMMRFHIASKTGDLDRVVESMAGCLSA